MKLLFIFIVAIVCFAPYAVNGYKLSQCDFDADYKCEAIHGIGVIVPPSALVTVWFDHDSEEVN